jgi:Neprosin
MYLLSKSQADGYISTGCYNTLCEGFVKVDNAPIFPGDVLPVSTADSHHELRIWIEKVAAIYICTFVNYIYIYIERERSLAISNTYHSTLVENYMQL